MAKYFKSLVIGMLLMVITMSANGQRPFFAGSRPDGGSQKDKYYVTQSSDITNRFAASDSEAAQNVLPFGAPQKPPMGVPLVTPESFVFDISATPSSGSSIPPTGSSSGSSVSTVFQNRFSISTPSTNPSAQPAPAATAFNTVQVSNRNGLIATPTVPARPTIQSSVPTATSATTNVQSSPLPLDAHGDRNLIDYLNQIPEDHRPFWYLNYQAIEEHRKGNRLAGVPTASRGSFAG